MRHKFELYISVNALRYDLFSMNVLSFIHNEQFFVPNVFCIYIGLPFRRTYKTIFSRICDGDGFEPGSKRAAKWVANESDRLPFCTSLCT